MYETMVEKLKHAPFYRSKPLPSTLLLPQTAPNRTHNDGHRRRGKGMGRWGCEGLALALVGMFAVEEELHRRAIGDLAKQLSRLLLISRICCQRCFISARNNWSELSSMIKI